MFDDSHCHLSFPELHERIDAIRSEMAAGQVDRALCICTTLEEFPRVHALATAYDNFWCTVGVHPDNEGVAEPEVNDLVERAALPRVVAIGETGLDYYRLGGRTIDDMAWQRERFGVTSAPRWRAIYRSSCTLAARAPTRCNCCAMRAVAECAASFTASPKRSKWRAPRSSSGSSSRFPAS